MNEERDHIWPEVRKKNDKEQESCDEESDDGSCHKVANVRQDSILFFFESNEEDNDSAGGYYEDNLIEQPPQKIIWLPL
jgi:hypothetical protein